MTEDVPKTDHLTHVDRSILYSLLTFLWLAAESFCIFMLANRFGFRGGEMDDSIDFDDNEEEEGGGDEEGRRYPPGRDSLAGGSAQKWDMLLGALGVCVYLASVFSFLVPSLLAQHRAVHELDDENEDDVIVHGENDVEVRGLIGSRQSSNIDRRRSTSKGINGVIRKRLDEWTARQASKRIKEKRTARLEEMAERAELQNTDGGGDDYDDIDIEDEEDEDQDSENEKEPVITQAGDLARNNIQMQPRLRPISKGSRTKSDLRTLLTANDQNKRQVEAMRHKLKTVNTTTRMQLPGNIQRELVESDTTPEVTLQEKLRSDDNDNRQQETNEEKTSIPRLSERLSSSSTLMLSVSRLKNAPKKRSVMRGSIHVSNDDDDDADEYHDDEDYGGDGGARNTNLRAARRRSRKKFEL